MSDPNNWIQNPPSTFVKIIGTTRDTINGKYGLCLQYNESKGRYVVLVIPTDSTTTGTTTIPSEQIALKSENLVICSYIEKMKAQYYMMRYNPDIQNQILFFYNTIQTFTKIKPEYLLIGILLLLGILTYIIGITKLLLLISIIFIIIIIILPDIQKGERSYKKILKNVPTNWKNIIIQQIPYNNYGYKIVNNKYLYILFTTFILFIFIKPFIPTTSIPFLSSKSQAQQQRDLGTDSFTDSSSSTMGTTTTSIPSSSLLVLNIEQIQKLYTIGYDDGIALKSDKETLPISIIQVKELLNIKDDESSSSYPYDSNTNNNDYTSTTNYMDSLWKGNSNSSTNRKLKSKNPINMQTGLSLFTLYRLLQPISMNNDGNFDIQLLKANLMTQDIWKLGLIGFSVYRLIAQFM